MKKTKAHQRYLTSKGEPAVGVTTIIGKIAKPYLIQWANKLGLDGIDSTKYVDSMANIGTLIHYLIECDIKSLEPDLKDYTANEIETAKSAFKKWLAWKSKTNFELIESEMQVVSDTLKVGGTLDIYAKIDGIPTVIDIKTSKAVYSEQKTQCVAYSMLLKENGKPVEQCRIIRIGRSENEGFDDILIGAKELHWKRFLAYLETYHADKNLENAGG